MIKEIPVIGISGADKQAPSFRVFVAEETTLPRTQEFTAERLRVAFELVKPSTHWKDPIDAEIDAGDKELIDRAIAFMVYGGAEFQDLGNNRVRVTAPGYWAMEGILESRVAERDAQTAADAEPEPELSTRSSRPRRR